MRILKAIKAWAGGVVIALDQLGNALIYGFPDETMSSRWGRSRKNGDGAARGACVILDAIDPDHCATSIEETASGEIDTHHSGRVIRELPPGAPRPVFRKVPTESVAIPRGGNVRSESE